MGAIVFRRSNEIFIHMSSFVSVSKSLVGHGLFFMLCISPLFGQQWNDPLLHYPRFAACDSQDPADHRNCFTQQINLLIQNAAKTWQVKNLVSGDVSVLFEVDKTGSFIVRYIDSPSDELRVYVGDFFKGLPEIRPASYNGRAIYMQFRLQFSPNDLAQIQWSFQELQNNDLDRNLAVVPSNMDLNNTPEIKSFTKQAIGEYGAVVQGKYQGQGYQSGVLIPLSHRRYDEFEAAMNQVGSNNHTAQKPYRFSEIKTYYDLKAADSSLKQPRKTWFGRKWWNEHMVAFAAKDYWFTLDPGLDIETGRDGDLATYNNTRLVHLQGGLGDNINISAVVYESQGRFAQYFNAYAESIKPDGGNPAIIPGIGIAKAFRADSYDYPIATGYVSYTPNKFFNLQFGHGKQFLGDGYRSLLLSDNASPYPYMQLNTTVWKLKYTNTWMSLRDVRPEVTADGSFRTKYMANHYLSYNVSRRLNLGFFETVVWENDNDRGFDLNYLNPIVFYRAIEFSTGSRGGNALLGLTFKYKWSDRLNTYGQMLIDEFSSSDVLAREGSYKNKTAYQLGTKYYSAFGIPNLNLQLEYNRVRPFTYSHNTVVLNYGHNNQSMAHTLGTNFSEFLAVARYRYQRFYGSLKYIQAKRGLEFVDSAEAEVFYGGSIYGSEDFREGDLNHKIGQGNTVDFRHIEFDAGYVINPSSQLKLFTRIILRSFSPEVSEGPNQKSNTTWWSVGLRTDLFNWYRDF